MKQKKLIIHPSTSLLFLLFYSPKPRSQVRILIYRKWSIDAGARASTCIVFFARLRVSKNYRCEMEPLQGVHVFLFFQRFMPYVSQCDLPRGQRGSDRGRGTSGDSLQ